MTRQQFIWALARVLSTQSEVCKQKWDGTAEHYYGMILSELEHAEAEKRAKDNGNKA